MRLLELMPELLSHIRLQNVLVKKGYLKRLIPLYAFLQVLFAPCFFPDGKAPSSVFAEAFRKPAGGGSTTTLLYRPAQPYRDTGPSATKFARVIGCRPRELEARALLNAAKADVLLDLCGDQRPLSSINFVSMAAVMMIQFTKFERELKERRNKLYQGDQCMRVMARVV
ncbi:hypothetical protein VTI74DRAFT_10553 [Chaetomium olivicolor]